MSVGISAKVVEQILAGCMNWKRVVFTVFAALLLLPGISLAQSVVTGGIWELLPTRPER